MKRAFQNIDEVYQFLEKIPMFGSRGVAAANFSLDTIQEFCTEIGDPQLNYPVIHVAGTNGKGTVCRMLASVYQSAGYKTGLYTSPHLLNVKERFKVNGMMIPEDRLIEFFQQYGEKAAEQKLTYFELTTAIAFWYFARENVELAIIETGLGGRLDATNIVDPALSVITSIGLDHTDILGEKIADIATEKAGIIKQNVPVVIGDLPPEAQKVIFSRTESTDSEIVCAMELKPYYSDNKIELTAEGKRVTFDAGRLTGIDAVNAAIVYASVQHLGKRFSVTGSLYCDGMDRLNERFPYHAHFEKLLPDRNWYFDGSHNSQAVEELLKQMNRIAPFKEWTVVLSMMTDKLKPGIVSQFSKAERLYLYPMNTERAANLDKLTEQFPFGITLQATDTLPEEWIKNQKSELVIFGGSFYFYSIVRRWMGAIASKK